MEEDVWLFEHCLLTLCIGNEVRREVALVELHSLCEIELDSEGVAFFDSDDSVFADLVDGIGDDSTNCCIGSRDGCDAGDIALVIYIFCLTLD